MGEKEGSVNKIELAPMEIRVPDFSEVGVTGLPQYAGQIHYEFLPQLRWPRAARIYQEMESNDPVIGAVLYVCEQLIRRVVWKVETDGNSRVDEDAREFVQTCLDDMSTTWTDTIAEILTMLPYGFAWHEEVYKVRQGDKRDPTKRSKYNDNRIGWRRLPGRAQFTIESWVFEEDGGVMAAKQIAAPEFKQVHLPIEKSLLFRAKYRYNNPEGRSFLRNAYRPWYFKKHIEEIEGIGVERDLAGLPVLITPEGVDIWNPHDEMARVVKAKAETLVRNIRRDQNEGVVLPYGWELTLLSSGSQRQFDTNDIINRYDQRIAITLLADIVMLGADKVGSFALANVKKSLLGVALEAVTNSIADVFNRFAIPRLVALNVFPGLTAIPRLVPGEVVAPDMASLARYIQALAGAKMPLFPNEDLEEYFRNVAGMPSLASQSPEEREEQLETTKPDEPNQGHPTGVDSRPDDGRMGNEGIPQGAGARSDA